MHKFRERWRDEIERSHGNTDISQQTYSQTSQDTGRINPQDNDNNASNRNDISYVDNNSNNQESMLEANFAEINLKDSKTSDKELILYKVLISIALINEGYNKL